MVLVRKLRNYFFLRKFKKAYHNLILFQKFQENFKPLSFEDYKHYLKDYYSTTIDIDDLRKNHNSSFDLLGEN